MAQQSRLFNEVINFTRGTGATRINAAGLIVGVDFSSTSITFGTGTRAFTLAANANVNRDWPVGSSVRAVSQAAPLGELTGTVTSYDPATQALVINVVTSTGTGTSTNWRIGSLEARRDSRGILQEVQVSSVLTGSKDLNGYSVGGALTLNSITGPDGNLSMHLLKDNGTAPVISRIYTPAKLGVHTMAFYVKAGPALAANRVLRFRPNNGAGQGANTFVFMNLLTGAILDNPNNRRIIVESRPNGVFFVRCVMDVVGLVNGVFSVGLGETNFSANAVPSDGVSDFYVSDIEYHDAEWTSSIPTTTIAVTRAADSFPATALTLDALRQGEGTIYVEAESADAGSAQKRALLLSGPTGDIRIAKRGVQTANFQRMATDGVTLVAAINAATNNTLRDNGKLTTTVDDGSGAAKFGVASSAIGKFLNVGVAETFRSTEDAGQSYTARTIGGTFGGAHFGLNRFVIAGSVSIINGATVGSVIVSPDGERLRRVNIPGLTQNLNEITSNTTNGVDGTLFLAVGAGGVLYTSPDAETWTPRTSGVTTAFNACAHGAGTFVAVSATAANSRYSADGGVTWLAVTGLTGTMTDVIHTGSQFVAINTVGGVFTSANGIAFTAVTTTGITPAFTSAQGIAFGTVGGLGYYVIVGNGGQVAVSQAAANASPATYITYTNTTTPSTGTTQNLSEVLAFNGKFYIVGGNQTIVEFDPVAVSFTSRVAGGLATNLTGIAASSGVLLVCGSNGTVATSQDGITFNPRNGNGVQLNGAAFGNGTYVVVGNATNGSGLIATVDPVTFEYRRRVSGVNSIHHSVKFLNNVFYATHVQAQGGVSRSLDNGQTWQRATYNAANTQIYFIAFDGTNLIAGDNVISKSIDGGATFNSINTVNASVRDMSFANGVFVGVGLGGYIVTSNNAFTTFAERPSGTTQNLNSVIYSTLYQAWIAAGANGTMLISYDNAVTWQPIGNSAFAAVDNNGIQANPTGPLWVNGVNKLALSFKANEVRLSINGSAPRVDTLATIPNINSILFGDNFNGYIKRVRVKPLAVDPQAETM